MTSTVLFYLVLLVAYNFQCEGFAFHTGSSKLTTAFSFQQVGSNCLIGSKGNSMMMSGTDSTVTELQLGRVTMYKKEGCPYCKLAQELLEGKYGVNITFVDIESPEKRDDILQQMRTFSGGRNTVPQIFFNSDHIGGNDDLQKLELDGKLDLKINKVRKEAVSMMQDNWFHPWY